MIINEHCVGKLYKEQKLPFIAKKYASAFDTMYEYRMYCWYIEQKIQKGNEYLWAPIDQFVASQFLYCGSLWEGAALSQ